MSNTVSNINTIKYLGSDGKFHIKFSKSKNFKIYDFTSTKENVSIVNKKINNSIKENQKELDKLELQLKKIFLKMLKTEKKERNKSDKLKKEIVKELKTRIDYLSALELSKSNIGIVEPDDVRYTNRKIII